MSKFQIDKGTESDFTMEIWTKHTTYTVYLSRSELYKLKDQIEGVIE